MKKTIAVISFLAVVGFGLTAGTTYACGFFTACSNDATAAKQAEQESVTGQLSRLTSAVPVPHLDDSLERANISKRLVLFSDPAKISYIYLVSYGKVMSYFVVKGKVTSGTKRLTSGQQVVQADWCGSGNCSLITDAPELDGTYGNSSPYVFFWTTDGTYVQWSGDYMLSDQPLQLTTTPELVRSVK